jgi:hypothetical protein
VVGGSRVRYCLALESVEYAAQSHLAICESAPIIYRRWRGRATAKCSKRSKIPAHESHAETLEWLGGDFDPHAFDAETGLPL